MSKFITVALLMVTSACSFAGDSEDLASLSVKNIVRAKLWYEGLDSRQSEEYEDAQGIENYPEELIVALDKFEL